MEISFRSSVVPRDRIQENKTLNTKSLGLSLPSSSLPVYTAALVSSLEIDSRPAKMSPVPPFPIPVSTSKRDADGSDRV